jgi:acetoin utilization protein AcuA
MQVDNKQAKAVFIKPPTDSINSMMSTALGRLHIRGPVNAEELNNYSLAEGLACFRPACRQHQALVELSREPDGIIFTASLANKIISYVTFQKPDYPWWQTRCFPSLLELGSIETDPAWRKMGLTNILLTNVFNNPDFKYFDDYVVMAVQFIHSWDLKNTALAPWAYRQFMLDLFKKYNFVTWETVDPEVREHPCNVLLARVGRNLDAKTISFFTGCCLGTNQ